MPTFGRLVGAILFGALAWYTTTLIVPLFPENYDFGRFREVNIFLGLYVGWTIAGSRAGTGYVAAFSYGLTATVVLVISALFLRASVEMVQNSLRRRYDGLSEAVTAVFEIFIETAAEMYTPEILMTLLFGGIGAGLVTEFFGRRYS